MGQASGLAVIVSDQGGPCENIHPGQTGQIVPGRGAGRLAAALAELCSEPDRLRNMGQQARLFAEERSFDAAFLATWDLYMDQQKPAA